MSEATGWDNGLCQDYSRELGRWFADRLGAKQKLKETFMTEHKDSQPKPASVEEILGLMYAYAKAIIMGEHSTIDPAHARSNLRQAITQQAEALAQALAEVERLKLESAHWHPENDELRAQVNRLGELITLQHNAGEELAAQCLEDQKEIDQLRTQLAALQYDGELPEPLIPASSLINEANGIHGRLYTADQVRQAIANDRAKRVPQGYKLVPVESTTAMENATIDLDAFKLGDISPMGFRISPQQLFRECYKRMIAAAPSPKDGLIPDHIKHPVDTPFIPYNPFPKKPDPKEAL
jgi:hypothetical protein